MHNIKEMVPLEEDSGMLGVGLSFVSAGCLFAEGCDGFWMWGLVQEQRSSAAYEHEELFWLEFAVPNAALDVPLSGTAEKSITS